MNRGVLVDDDGRRKCGALLLALPSRLPSGPIMLNQHVQHVDTPRCKEGLAGGAALAEYPMSIDDNHVPIGRGSIPGFPAPRDKRGATSSFFAAARCARTSHHPGPAC